jgi:alanine racemase
MHWRLAGRISMDQTTVAVDSDFPVTAGDEAVLIGRQGDREVGAEELARVLGTISYEIVSGLSIRLPRIYRPRS